MHGKYYPSLIMKEQPDPARQARIDAVIREHFGNVKKEMAEKTGISQPDISRLLKDNVGRRSRNQKFGAIAQATGLSVAWLENGTGPKYGSDHLPSDGDLFADFMKTSPVGINELARRLQRGPSTVSEYQTPGRVLSDELKQEIATALDVAVDAIFPVAKKQQRIPARPLDEEEYVELPHVPLAVRAGSDVARYWQHPTETYRVPKGMIPPGSKRDWWVIDVNGDSMGDKVPSGSRVLGYRLTKESDWRLAPARVWAIQYGDEFVIKRVRANNLERDHGLLLHSDNPPPDPFFVAAEDINQIWVVKKVIIEADVY